ncbi:MAG: cell division protein FtsX [Ignavibacteria bacterium]|nr:MAG: cell division protein FtsX [Ignavibacteria bacterium]KAF0162413.1 MAG: cell division protein FtsX [Ignavibacteria bacterium]
MIAFYFSEAFRLFRKNGYNSFVLIFITSLAVFVTIASISIVLGVQQIDKTIKTGIKLNTFLKGELSQIKIDSIQIEIEKISEVKSALFISQEEASNLFVKETGENFRNVLDENPLPSSFRVSLKSSLIDENAIVSLSNKIKTIYGVDDVVYDNETTLKLLKILKMIQYFFYPLSVLLVLLSIYLVNSNNKLLIKQNANLFRTMSLVGGKEGSIRIPVILNGFFIGIISSLVCVALFNLTVVLLTAFVNNLKFGAYYLAINALIAVIGISLGIVGSYLSSRLIVKQKNTFTRME